MVQSAESSEPASETESEGDPASVQRQQEITTGMLWKIWLQCWRNLGDERHPVSDRGAHDVSSKQKSDAVMEAHGAKLLAGRQLDSTADTASIEGGAPSSCRTASI
jgi:hypothetical protein